MSEEAHLSGDLLLGEAVQRCKQALLTLDSNPDERKREKLKDSVADIRQCIDQLLTIKSRLECPNQSIRRSTKTTTAQEQSCVNRVSKLFEGFDLSGRSDPGPLTDEEKTQLLTELERLLQAGGRILFVGLLTCPWLALVEPNQPLQLHIVYHGPELYFLDPSGLSNEATQHQIHTYTAATTPGKQVPLSIVVMEMRGWSGRVFRGQPASVELLFLPARWVLLDSADWRAVVQGLHQAVQGEKSQLGSCLNQSFARNCFGQAIESLMPQIKGSSRRKPLAKPSSKLTASLCSSLRLLGHLECLRRGQLVLDSNEDQLTALSTHSVVCLSAIRQLEAEHTPDTGAVLARLETALLDWHADLQANMSPLQGKFSWLENWLCQVRLAGRSLPSCSSWSAVPGSEQHRHVASILADIEAACPRSLPPGLTPERVVMVTRAGSRLYNLSTKQSDTDWLVVYADPTVRLVSCADPSNRRECFECRGPAYDVEFGAYEARMISDMLLKGSVVHLELVLIDPDRLDYASSAWRWLHERATNGLINEVSVSQCMGLIWNMVDALRKGRGRAEKHPGKLLYQVRHKLIAVESLISGKRPAVRIEEGPQHDWVMAAREMDLPQSTERAELESKEMMTRLAERRYRLVERCDENLMIDWLKLVHDWTDDDAT